MKNVIVIVIVLLMIVLVSGSLPKDHGRHGIRSQYKNHNTKDIKKTYVYDDAERRQLSSSLPSTSSSSPPSSRRRRSTLSLVKDYSVAFGIGLGLGLSAVFLGASRVYETAGDISTSTIASKNTISGTVVKVIDGDTYRLRHQPTPFSSASYQGPMSSHTIVVRDYAIDTPELPKNGLPGQKYAQEAKNFAKNKLLNKKVRVQCLGKDQYGRLIGKVTYKENTMLGLMASDKDISMELVTEGLATIYRGGGAQYGDMKLKQWNQLEDKVKINKKGMWKDIISGDEKLPNEYKKAANANTDSNTIIDEKTDSNSDSNKKSKRRRKEFVGPTGNNNNMVYNGDDKNMLPSKRGIKRWADKVQQ